MTMKKTVALMFATALTLSACSDSTMTDAETETESAVETTTEETSEEPSQEETEPTEEETSESSPTEDDTSEEESGDSQFTLETTQSEGFPGLEGEYELRGISGSGGDEVDTFIIEYEGDPSGVLNWHAEYTATPMQQGSGAPPNVEGETYLHIMVSGLVYNDGVAVELNHQLESNGKILDAEANLPFEGMHDIFIAMDEERPYQVRFEPDPARLVIDLAAPEA